MATVTVKTYRCDNCGDKVEGPKDLRKFFVEWGAAQRYGYDRNRPGIRVELCKAKCVEAFAAALLPFVDQQGYDAIVPPQENGSAA